MVATRELREVVNFLLDKDSVSQKAIPPQAWPEILLEIVKVIPVESLRGFGSLADFMKMYERMTVPRLAANALFNVAIMKLELPPATKFFYCGDIQDTAGTTVKNALRRPAGIGEGNGERFADADTRLLLLSQDGKFYQMHIRWEPKPSRSISDELWYDACEVTLNQVHNYFVLEATFAEAYNSGGNRAIGMHALQVFSHALHTTRDEMTSEIGNVRRAERIVTGCLERITR